LINLVSTCIQCGSPVTDSLDSEVEEQGQLKRGKYVNSVWICNDCTNAQIKGVKNDQREESMTGVATPSDVSPNTPKADEANL
jgi:uncharacterized protein with PIN domain